MQTGLTLKSKGLTETARARTSTSSGFRSGTSTDGRTSRTSGPPNRGRTTARHVITDVDAALKPSPSSGLRRHPATLHIPNDLPELGDALSPEGCHA